MFTVTGAPATTALCPSCIETEDAAFSGLSATASRTMVTEGRSFLVTVSPERVSVILALMLTSTSASLSPDGRKRRPDASPRAASASSVAAGEKA